MLSLKGRLICTNYTTTVYCLSLASLLLFFFIFMKYPHLDVHFRPPLLSSGEGFNKEFKKPVPRVHRSWYYWYFKIFQDHTSTRFSNGFKLVSYSEVVKLWIIITLTCNESVLGSLVLGHSWRQASLSIWKLNTRDNRFFTPREIELNAVFYWHKQA